MEVLRERHRKQLGLRPGPHVCQSDLCRGQQEHSEYLPLHTGRDGAPALAPRELGRLRSGLLLTFPTPGPGSSLHSKVLLSKALNAVRPFQPSPPPPPGGTKGPVTSFGRAALA